LSGVYFSGEKLREDVESVKIKIPYRYFMCGINASLDIWSMHRSISMYCYTSTNQHASGSDR